jgi:hypothetical protein
MRSPKTKKDWAVTFTEGLIKTLILRYSQPGVFCPCFPVTAQMVCHFVYGILLSDPIIFLPPHTMSIHHCKAKCCHRHITNSTKSVQTGTFILKQTGVPGRILYVRQLVGRWRLASCRICGAVNSGSSSFWLSRAASCG